jgi:hypothetical protein
VRSIADGGLPALPLLALAAAGTGCWRSHAAIDAAADFRISPSAET